MRYLDFKTIDPFFSLCRDGQKPFDIRLYESGDTRFNSLRQLPNRFLEGWAVRFTNPANGEVFCRVLTGWLNIEDEHHYCVKPRWVILYLGGLLPETEE